MPDFAFDAHSLIVFGGGGHGKTLIELVQASGMFTVAGIVDDGLQAGSQVLGVPVLGTSAVLPELHRRGLRLAANGVGGINNVAARVRVFELLAEAGFTCPNLVHPRAWVEHSARLMGGVQVLAQAYIGSDSIIGFGSVINAGAVVSHDCQLGQCVNLSPGALLAGGVHVEDYVQIGMGATINLNLTIGRAARVGNGATVKADVPPEGRVYAGAVWPAPGLSGRGHARQMNEIPET